MARSLTKTGFLWPMSCCNYKVKWRGKENSNASALAIQETDSITDHRRKQIVPGNRTELVKTNEANALGDVCIFIGWIFETMEMGEKGILDQLMFQNGIWDFYLFGGGIELRIILSGGSRVLQNKGRST